MTTPLHGVIVGRVKESHPHWIVVGDRVFFLDGEACHHKIGMTLQVVYLEQDGRSHVKRIAPIPAVQEMIWHQARAGWGEGPLEAAPEAPQLRRDR